MVKRENIVGYKKQYWWLMLFSGFTFICLGAGILIAPVSSYLYISQLFAFAVFFSGVFEIVYSIANSKYLQGWGWTLASGMVDVFLGVYLIYFPLLSLVVAPIIIGLWMLFRGCMAIGSSIELRAYGVLDWTWLMVTGVLIVVLSILIITYPQLEVVNIIVWTAFAFLLCGIFRVYLSLQMKTLIKDLRSGRERKSSP